jgi:hypothetical protein
MDISPLTCHSILAFCYNSTVARRIDQEIEIELDTTRALHFVCRIVFGCSKYPFTTHINVGRDKTIRCLSPSEIGNRKSADLFEHEHK